ncbi:xanthine dehydrogenase family protein molybdopterin-binding subunit, partial [Streptomyces sp. NPDC059564]|uniref:xanthine dehydrogenase family protein molybdopterin-binding subunit n=1 Tax=Streptomyces sp. NPDC059564 TaxID=3346865 RepID=UPI0036B11BB7
APDGWPPDCSHALLLRSGHVDRPYAGLDWDLVPAGLRPDAVVTAADLTEPPYRNRITTDQVQALLPAGQLPDYLGQPVAIAVYSDFLRFRRAAQELRESTGPVLHGPPPAVPVPPQPGELAELEEWTQRRFTGTQHQAHFLLDHTAAAPYSLWDRGRVDFDGTAFVRGSQPDAEAEALFAALRAESADPAAPGVQVVTTTFTQQTDPAFLEPEAGLGWLDRSTATLHLLLGTQSPHGDVPDVRNLVGAANPLVRRVVLADRDCGGGFGGRDKSPFPFYLALAAVFAPGPVRLAYDRREQFQGGLKRHGSAVRSWLRAGPDGKLTAVRSFVVLRGGVEANLNGAVLSLAALHATGPYRVPRASVHGIVLERPIPAVGSMRGFGIPQVAFNIETAVDRLAVRGLGTDPIAFRLANVLRQAPAPGTGPAAEPADTDLAGTPLRFHLANAEICAAALDHPLWRTRDDPGPAEDGVRYGVGFACCMEAYGTSQDSVYSAVRVAGDGTVEVWGQTVDMGQGARSSLERAAQNELGAQARVHLGVVGPFERFAQQLQERGLHGAVKISLSHGASSASKTAFFHVHVLREVCRALLRLRLLPAARTLLGEPGLSDEELLAGWSGGALRLAGRRELALAELAAEAERTGGETYAMAHGYFCNGWSRAAFPAAGGGTYEAAVDALGLGRSPDTGVTPLEPQGALRPPPTRGPGGAVVPRSLYASAGHLVKVAVDARQGRIRVVEAVTFLDAGDPLVPAVLESQAEGGLAMGISQTLYEELPAENGGGPFVNLDRYRLPHCADLAGVRRETVLVPLGPDGVLGPGGPSVRHKGVGEAVMTGVGPAIANAVAHALGHTGDDCWPVRLPIRLADLPPLPAPGGP